MGQYWFGLRVGHLITAGWLPESQAEKNSVLEQLERLFTHQTFKNSKRCQALLRYVVEHHLQGAHDPLKERTLGMEVFGRKADYDTNSDPVVRTTASEVRKRIAQYYHEPGHENEIRIELPLGSYTPEFCLPPVSPAEPETAMDLSLSSVPPGVVLRRLQFVGKQSRRYPYAVLAFILVALAGAVASRTWMSRPPSALDQFWNSIVGSSAPIQLCVGTWPMRPAASASSTTPSTSPSSPSPGMAPADPPSPNALQEASIAPRVVAWSDLVASSKIIGFLEKRHKGYRVENASVTTMNDLTQGPTVLVAAYNNPWTLGMTDPLRFHFVRGDHESWIADRKNPSKHYARAPGTLPESVQDYAIVARLFNSATGEHTVVVAGLGAAGTIAASSFVTNPSEVEILAKMLPRGWQSKNIEALISVQTVDGEPGAPSIQAVEVW